MEKSEMEQDDPHVLEILRRQDDTASGSDHLRQQKYSALYSKELPESPGADPVSFIWIGSSGGRAFC